jgi:hypothetical protein
LTSGSRSDVRGAAFTGAGETTAGLTGSEASSRVSSGIRATSILSGAGGGTSGALGSSISLPELGGAATSATSI